MSSYTPIKDIDQKLDIIDHVNQDHPEEVLAIANSYQTSSHKILAAKVLDIFEEGVNIEVQRPHDTDQVFAPFQIKGELEDQILYLAYAAIVKEGRDVSGNGKHFFEVTKKENITQNIVRISVTSATPLPEYYPAYAYAFLLKTMPAIPMSQQNNPQGKSWGKKLFDRLFIWLMKHLSPKNREKLLQSANKDVRLYTLRKSWQDEETELSVNHGYIDIFTHGNTAGSQWANSLAINDVIMSRSESADKHKHLESGQALLIADETAYPALAGILEKWQNPLQPHVILFSSCAAEQAYFEKDGVVLPEGQVHQLICPPQQQAEQALEIIQKLTSIDVVWAACEAQAAKEIRHYIRNERKIEGKKNHTKAYWSLKTKRKG